MVKVLKKGESKVTLTSFEALKAGDTVFHLGNPVEVDEDAHYSGDASYAGYLFYDRKGGGWFPEDLDTGEEGPVAQKKVVLGRLGETTRLFEVDEHLSTSELTALYDAMLDVLYAEGKNLDASEVSHDVLEEYGFHPYPVETFLIPDRHLGYERMMESGISFASCGACEHCEGGSCMKYGGETESDPMYNQDCCMNEELCQVLDGNKVVEYFILRENKLLQSPKELLHRLSAWSPAVKTVLEEHGKTLRIRHIRGNQTEYRIP